MRLPQLLVLSVCFLAGSAPTVAAPVELFPLTSVRLLEGPFRNAQDRDREYLLALNPDRLLAGFRLEAGLPAKAAKYPNWESKGLDGHTLGHYLSALSQLWASTGDPEARRRLDYIVGELAAVQQANGDGYVGAVPNGREIWREVAAGHIDANGFSLKGAWAPWYNLHKTFAGLRDAFLVAGNVQARTVLVGYADWCGSTVGKLSDQQMQLMLRTEQGGMNEVLADVGAITGDRKYLTLAERFSHRAILEPLLRREDRLTGIHANTQIPKVIGFARIAELDPARAEWRGAAEFFWDTVVNHRSVAFGGDSVREHFNPADDFTTMLESREGPETCNTYNMLRLTERLYGQDPAVRYVDFYERALYNHILSAEHPQRGGFVYFTPIRPQHYRVYSQPDQCFWCCVGTGMESHTKHGRFIYAHAGDALLVNLFIASDLDWAERGLKLRQETRFPDEPVTRLTFSLAQPRRFPLRIRHPGWVAAGAFRLKVNGQPWPEASAPSSYAEIDREWRDGDRVEVVLPMQTTVERLPDHSDYVAILHGPILLAARTDDRELDGLVAGAGRMGHVAPGPFRPLDTAPMFVGAVAAIPAAIRPEAGAPLTFSAAPLLRPDKFKTLTLEPFFRIHDFRYMMYWRVVAPGKYDALVAELKDREEAQLDLERRTLDLVRCGEQQPEVEHAFAGERTSAGYSLGRPWREAAGSFGYSMQAPREGGGELQLMTWGLDEGSRYTIWIDDHPLGRVVLNGKDGERLVVHPYPLPAKAGGEGTIRVRLVPDPGSRIAPVYELRVVRVKP